jgi:hypothetical protein
LADLRDYRLVLAVLAEVRQQKQSPRQSFLAGAWRIFCLPRCRRKRT